MSDRILDLLEETTSRRVAALPVTPSPVALVARAVERDRARRRISAAAGVAVALVVLVLASLVVSPRDESRQLPTQPRPSLSASPPGLDLSLRDLQHNGSVTIDGVAWPVAGELAGDPAFLTEARDALTRVQREYYPDAPAELEVVFAGDVGLRRLVVGRDSRGSTLAVVGRRGSGAETLDLAQGASTVGDPEGPVTVLLPDEGQGSHVLAMAPLGMQLEVSERPRGVARARKELHGRGARGGRRDAPVPSSEPVHVR